jgi:hypothetical protein
MSGVVVGVFNTKDEKEERMLRVRSLLSIDKGEGDIMSEVQQSYTIPIGNKAIAIEDDDFVQGYDAGYDAYRRYHRDDTVIDASLLLSRLRNGWNSECSDMWTTGYLMGWLTAFYEQEEGQLARSIDVNPENVTSNSTQQAS